MQFPDELRPALAWLRTSGIQRPDGDADAGGVHAWIDEATGRPGFLYSEITGYFMTHAAWLARLQPEAGWLERARGAAAWIVDRAMTPDGAVLARKYGDAAGEAGDPYSFTGRRVLYFDATMVGYGLVLTARATGEARWRDAARRIADHLLVAFEVGGERFAAHDLATATPTPHGDRWSQDFGSFQLKSAYFLMALAQDLGDAGAPYRALCDRVLAGALATQRDDGRFPTDRAGDATHLHPHTYTIEGLLGLVANHGRTDLLPAIARAIDWSFSVALRPTSPVQQWSATPGRTIAGLRSDVVAQSLRAHAIYRQLAPSPGWAWEAELPAIWALLDGFRPRAAGPATASTSTAAARPTPTRGATCSPTRRACTPPARGAPVTSSS
ncbi:MAG: hypothetical protein R2939_17925 [Kofleriaceae bacterium]